MKLRAALLCLLFGTSSCKPEPSPAQGTADATTSTREAGAASTMDASASSADAAATTDTTAAAVRELTLAWSGALDAHDVATLGTMYGPRVRFYGRDVSRAAVVAAKKAALGPGSTFHQRVTSEVTVSAGAGGVFSATFTKRSGSKAMSEVRARLGVIRGDGGALAIVEETDEPSLGREGEARRDACYRAAADAVNDLPAVKKLLADTQKEIDAHYSDRALGGIGPIDADDGFSAGLGVHQPDRYEALVWYAVHGGKLDVQVMGEDAHPPKAALLAVATACGASGADGG